MYYLVQFLIFWKVQPCTNAYQVLYALQNLGQHSARPRWSSHGASAVFLEVDSADPSYEMAEAFAGQLIPCFASAKQTLRDSYYAKKELQEFAKWASGNVLSIKKEAQFIYDDSEKRQTIPVLKMKVEPIFALHVYETYESLTIIVVISESCLITPIFVHHLNSQIEDFTFQPFLAFHKNTLIFSSLQGNTYFSELYDICYVIFIYRFCFQFGSTLDRIKVQLCMI